MMKVGFVGWRGMVGSVLMQRMREENDFAHVDPVFFSTSNVGGTAPLGGEKLLDAGAAKIITGGTIALQSESHPVEFRKVELKPLPAEGE